QLGGGADRGAEVHAGRVLIEDAGDAGGDARPGGRFVAADHRHAIAHLDGLAVVVRGRGRAGRCGSDAHLVGERAGAGGQEGGGDGGLGRPRGAGVGVVAGGRDVDAAAAVVDEAVTVVVDSVAAGL